MFTTFGAAWPEADVPAAAALAWARPRPHIEGMEWRCVPHAGEHRAGPQPTGSLAGYVWRLSGAHQLALGALALAVAALAMAPLELQRRLVNEALGAGDLGLLARLGGVYLAVVVTTALGKFALRMYQGWLAESAVLATRSRLARVHACRSEAHEEDGRAVSIIDREVDQLGGFVGEGPSSFVVNAGMLAAIVGYMLVVQPVVAAVGLAVLAPQAVLVPVLQRRVNRAMQTRVALLRELGDQVAEEGGRTGAPRPRVERHLRAIYDNRLVIYALKYGMKSATNLLTNAAPLGVLLVGGWLVIEGEATVGVVVAFLSGLQRLEDPLRELLNAYRLAAQARVRHDMIARWT
jgi:ABC-type multidrug transport system fused ATPase/permease subunit